MKVSHWPTKYMYNILTENCGQLRHELYDWDNEDGVCNTTQHMVHKVRVQGIPLAMTGGSHGVSLWGLTDWGPVTARVVVRAINHGMGGMASQAGMTVPASC